MHRKISALIIAVFLLAGSSGCAALLAGAAGGAIGAAVWMNGKLDHTVEAPLFETAQAAEHALESLSYSITKIIVKKNIGRFKALDKQGRTAWIDLVPIDGKTVKISIRVGMKGDKKASRDILGRILDNLK